MTTVACDGKSMAADSLMVDGDIRCQMEKIFRFKEGLIGIAGDVCHGIAFVNWMSQPGRKKSSEFPDPRLSEDGFDAIVLYRDGRMESWNQQGVPTPLLIPFWAIGSGASAALGALMAGASLEESVEIACRIDAGSAGPVRVESPIQEIRKKAAPRKRAAPRKKR